jgi:two-component system chemotaxis response regulator CheB
MTVPKAVVIGASAGGVAALSRLFGEIGAGFPLPILLVLHIAGRANADFSYLFGNRLRVAVAEAEEKDVPAPGRVYVAPPGYHLLVEPDHSLSLSVDAPVLFSRPSIDVLFESAAVAYGPRVAGVLLTGASADGAAGLAAIAKHGGLTAVQALEDAEVPTMPESAMTALRDARRRPDKVGTAEDLGRWIDGWRAAATKETT